MEKKRRTSSAVLTAAKVIMMCLTVVFPLFMVVLAGAGLIYNKESYGDEIEKLGVLLIISGILMTAGAVFCLFRKNLLNYISVIFSGGGLALCMTMLYKLCGHADRAGWSDPFTMTPVSDMYKARIMPSIAPAAIAIVIAVLQLLSYEAAEERRRRRARREAEENAPAPKIIDD